MARQTDGQTDTTDNRTDGHVSMITAFIRTDEHGLNDSASDPDQEYIYFMLSETLPSAAETLPSAW